MQYIVGNIVPACREQLFGVTDSGTTVIVLPRV